MVTFYSAFNLLVFNIIFVIAIVTNLPLNSPSKFHFHPYFTMSEVMATHDARAWGALKLIVIQLTL